MIFTITPLVQEAKTKRQWLRTFGIFTAALVVVLGAFGAAMAWAGAAVAAKVTTPWAREAIASIALTVVGVLALVVAPGGLGVTRPLLPQVLQERVRLVGGVALAVAGGFMLSMWTLRATWALFFTRA